MAVVGARPATGIGIFGRRSLQRPVREPRSRARHAGAARRQRQASIVALLSVIAASAGLGFFYLSQSTHVAAVGYEIDALHARIAALRAEQQQLVIDISGAQAPTQILEQAKTRLHLVPIDQSAVGFAAPPTAVANPSPSPDPPR